MIRHILTVSAGTFASRLLGFLRDVLIAALLGAGMVADAFLVAFQMITVVRRFLGEGALNAVLVPAYLDVETTSGPAAAAAFAGRVLATLSVLVVGAAMVGLVAMPLLVSLIAPGFVGTDALRLCIDTARLMLPYVAFAGPVTVMLALLNVRQRYGLTALSPVLFNLALIVVMVILMLLPRDADAAATAIAVTIGFAGLLQLAILFGSGRTLAAPLRVSFDRPMRDFLARCGPGMIAGAGPQLLIVAGAIVASSSPSHVSWLYFASRLIDLPLGLVGVAMGTVLVPELSRALRAGDAVARVDAESRGIEMALGLALPAAFGLALLGEPIVRVLFEHGAFGATDTHATARALTWLALGLPAQILVKALSPAFFARGDVVTPLIATLMGVVAAIVAAIALESAFGVEGIAAAIAFAGWSSAIVLIVRGATTFGFGIDVMARRRLPRILLAACMMAAALWLAGDMMAVMSPSGHGAAQIAALGVVIVAAIVFYGAMLAVLGVVNPAGAVRAFRRDRRT